ncbi:MAG: Holliday junction resolvase RuvX [Candidatus Peribacteraceae bacterium]
MSGILALDIGTKRTGLAYAQTGQGFVMALDTLRHDSTDELIALLRPIAKGKKVGELIVGLPRLLSGVEGKQAGLVRKTADAIAAALRLPVTFVDERFTSGAGERGDPDARAACAILSIVLAQREKKS